MPSTPHRMQPAPRQRNRRGEGGRLRGELLDAAATLMAATGREDAVTLRAVTRVAGVSPQSFYLHFSSTDELLWALYTREFAELTTRLRAAAEPANQPRARLDAICAAYVGFAVERPSAYRRMFTVTGTVDHDWDGELPGSQAFRFLQASVTDCRPDLPPADAARATSLLWAGLHGLVTLRNDRPAFPWAPIHELVQGLLDVLLQQNPDST